MSDTQERPREEAEHQQVKLKIWHPGCWTLETTKELPGTHIIENAVYTATDNVRADLILITDGKIGIETFVETVRGHPVVESVTVLGRAENRRRVLVVYDSSSSIIPHVADEDFVPIEPIYITDGHEHWTVMARERTFGELIFRLQREFEVEIVSIEGFSPDQEVAFIDLIDCIELTLSDRQRESLLAAYEANYYRWPREASATDVANSLGISNPTFLEHLRVAEQKVMNVVLDNLVNGPFSRASHTVE